MSPTELKELATGMAVVELKYLRTGPISPWERVSP